MSTLAFVSSNLSLLPGPPTVRAKPIATGRGGSLGTFIGPASWDTEQGKEGQRMDGGNKERITRSGRNQSLKNS